MKMAETSYTGRKKGKKLGKEKNIGEKTSMQSQWWCLGL